MSETYTRINWKDGENGGTPISADNLNLMDLGIEKAHQLIEELKENGVGGVTEEQLKNAVDAYFIKNPIQTVSDIFMRVSDGYIQFSTDNLTWKNVIAVSELKGQTGKTAYEYAKDGGYTGTEEEFAKKLAQENPTREEFSQLSDTVNDKVTNPTSGAVGQILEIETVDEKGKPKTYKAVNKPTSSGTGTETVVSSVEPDEEDIPMVFFSEPIPQTKDDVVTEMYYISKTMDFKGYAEFKAQGNSSMNFAKKNMTVKMYKDEALEEKNKVDFKGWGKQRKHVYKANWIDITHARNVVSARIWADVVKSRADYMSLPELLRTSPNQGAVDGFPIKVYSQGVYQGRYTLNIPKDAWMANMDDSLDTHCILCGENYASGCFRALARIDESDWTDELHEVVPDSIKTRWNESISFVMNSTDEEFKTNLKNYFNVNSLIDKFIFGLVACDLDGFGKNQLYFTYDGIIWIASEYDLDCTWGMYWDGSLVASDYARSRYEDYKVGQGNLLYIRLESLFKDEIKARYEEIKKGALSVANIISKFERFINICPPELVEEDYATTTANGAFTGIPSKTTNNIQQIRKFVVERYAYVDSYIDNLASRIPCESITLDKTTLTFTSNSPQTLVATVTPTNTTDEIAWSTSEVEIATVSNGVVVPITNGSCIITATCGDYSATCEVSISGLSDFDETITPLPDTLDYTHNAIANVAWYDDCAIDGNGEYVEYTAGSRFSYATSRFLMQDCIYCISGFGANMYPNIHAWDENDVYVGCWSNIERFAGKTGYKFALEIISSTEIDTDSTTLTVFKTSAKKYASVNLKDLDSSMFTKPTHGAFANGVEINIYDATSLGLYGYNIDNISIPMSYNKIVTAYPKDTTYEPMFVLYHVSGNVRLYMFNFSTVEEAYQYCQDNEIIIEFNTRLKTT